MKIQRNWFRWCVSNDEAWKSTISLPIGCGHVTRLSPGSIVLENFIVQWKVYAGKTSLAHVMWENRQHLILHVNNICCARTHSPFDHRQILLDIVDWSFVVTFMPIFKNSANLIPKWFGQIECVMNWTSLGHIIWVSNSALIVRHCTMGENSYLDLHNRAKLGRRTSLFEVFECWLRCDGDFGCIVQRKRGFTSLVALECTYILLSMKKFPV